MNTTPTPHTYRRGQVILHLDTFLHIIDRVIEENETSIKATFMGSDYIYTFDKSVVQEATQEQSLHAYAVYSYTIRDRVFMELYPGDRVRIFGQEYEYVDKHGKEGHIVIDPTTGQQKHFDEDVLIFLPYR